MIRKIKSMLITYKSLLNKRDENLWVFGAWMGLKYSDNPKYLFLEALKNDINAVWITKSPEIYNELKQKKLPVEMWNSKKGIKIQKEAGVAIYCVGNFDLNEKYLSGALLINLIHGVANKKIYYDNTTTNREPVIWRLFKNKILKGLIYRKEYYLSTSPATAKTYITAFRTNYKHIIKSGLPRNDIFFDSDYCDETDFSFLKGRKMISYLPTHRQGGAQFFEVEKIIDLDAINEVCKNNNYVFAIKKHFYHRNENTLKKDYSNIIDLTHTEVDTQELLKHTDILISDYSSVFIDYLLLDRPIIFYNFDFEEYSIKDVDTYFKYEDVTPGQKVKEKKELTKRLEYLCQGYSDGYEKERQKCIDFFFDGKRKICSKDIIEKIKNLC